MKKFIIALSGAIVGALFGAYVNEKYNLGVKNRVDGIADRFRKAEKPSETTTDNESASTEASAS